MNVTIKAIKALPINQFMSNVDLCENGHKVYVKAESMSYTQSSETDSEFNRAIRELCFNKNYPLYSEPIFIFAYSDMGNYLIFFKRGINQISTGNKCYLFADIIKGYGLYPITDNHMIVTNIGIENNGKIKLIDTYNPLES